MSWKEWLAVAAMAACGAAAAPAQTAAPAAATPQAQPPAQAAPAATPAAPAQAAPPRNQHVAKTRPEYDAYLEVMSQTDLAAAEAAAADFEARFPDSDLKGVLYQHLMDKYQEANNAPKMLAMARKVIQFQPDEPVALSTAATILAESTHDTDADRDQRFTESEEYARHAITSIDTLPAPANWTPQQFQDAKNVILSYAHAAIGFVELRKGNNGDAEKELRTATELNQSQPDAPTWYRLALALDHEQKYTEALAAINHALQVFHPDDAMYPVAKEEQTRLTMLVPPAAPAPSTPAAPATPPSTAPPPPKD